MIVTYRDADITSAVRIKRCVFEQREDGRLPTLTIDLDDSARTWDRWGSSIGDKISVLEDSAPKTGDLYVASCEPRMGTWRIRATPLQMGDHPRTQSWVGTGAVTALTQIAGQLGLTLECHGLYDAPLVWARQDGTNMEMAQLLATLAGASIDVYDGTMHVWSHDWAVSRGTAGTVELTGESEVRLVRRRRFGSCRITQAPMANRAPMAWEYVADAALPGMLATVPDSIAYGDTKPLEVAARAALAQANARQDYGSVAADSLSPYTPGVAVRIASDVTPSFSGTALVTRVRNDLLNKRSKTWWRAL